MTTYRLYTSGDPPALVSYSGDFEAGVLFTVTTGNCWFTGWYWGVPAGGDTGGQRFALWNHTGAAAGCLIASATSGVLTAGQWNFIPAASPVPLGIGMQYNACTGWVAVNGFPATNKQFGSGQPFAAGIANGPLLAYSDTSGSKPSLYGTSQGVFSVGGSDPTVVLPTNQSNSANFGMDVQVSDTAPSGYHGSWRLWPSAFGVTPQTVADAAADYDICVEAHLLRASTSNRVWMYSPPGSVSLPTRVHVWSIASRLEVLVNASPSWSGAAGSGWVSCPLTGTIPAGAYRVGVYNSAGGGGPWTATDNASDYWGTGTGGSGITSGPLYAPPIAAASICYNYNSADGAATPPFSDGTTRPGQSPFGQTPDGADIFPELVAPGIGGSSQNYWIDWEVTPIASGLLIATGII